MSCHRFNEGNRIEIDVLVCVFYCFESSFGKLYQAPVMNNNIVDNCAMIGIKLGLNGILFSPEISTALVIRGSLSTSCECTDILSSTFGEFQWSFSLYQNTLIQVR